MQAWGDFPAIMLLDLDAFFASVEQLDHPDWRGKAVIVGGDAGSRGVVSTCSYEARKYGVHSAMPSAQAKRMCPNAIWTHGHYARYREISKQVMDIMLRESPYLQQVSIDEAFMDVSPGRFGHEHPIMIAQRIQENVSKLGVTCSIGLGISKSVSKVASEQDKPNGLTVVYPGSEAAFLAPMPVRALSGVGRQAEKHLHDAGIMTLGEMAHADLNILRPIYGKNAELMRLRACGQDKSPVERESEAVKSVSNEVTFSTNLIERSEIEQAIAMIAAKVARRLRREGLAGYTVTLTARYADLTRHNAQKTL
ncbi:MAG: DNA polymerase IV, partial [Coriobacteriales bacterium]|nr:DNA polymerase IV [Coriobacteriales bacterium]